MLIGDFMKKLHIKTTSLVLAALLVGFVTPYMIVSVRGQDKVLLHRNKCLMGIIFGENYWDIMVHNNSNWEVEDPLMNISNMTTWLNNTWNIKWISEGNFEMGFLAFMNKSGIDDDTDAMAFTPGQKDKLTFLALNVVDALLF